LKVILNSVDLRTNIDVMKILVKLLIHDYLHIPCTQNTINEKYLLVIAAGMLRPISKYI